MNDHEPHDCPLTNTDLKNLKENYCNKDLIMSMQDDINGLKSDIKAIRDALIGDDFNPGFKQRIEKVESDTDKNTVRLNRVYIYGAAVISILGIITTLIKIGII
jgi:hypothetical protein